MSTMTAENADGVRGRVQGIAPIAVGDTACAFGPACGTDIAPDLGHQAWRIHDTVLDGPGSLEGGATPTARQTGRR
ncbi:hypothetical protein [Streptomonospora salina]|uniref:Uncharacterized protein n=1 Tax=Streptomonospora salina TaxID=104205 RepID=A0A841EAQ6_9ACTN|nr:hypothetical protein [Streptomonospora salina]MBB5996551.1 hypothetical protein [Streptomonospora salina]